MAKRISVDARRELVRAIGERYRVAAREDKLQILDEFVAVTGYHRKHSIRILNDDSTATAPVRAPRLRLYDEAVREVLIVLWEAADRICGKRLKALVPVRAEERLRGPPPRRVSTTRGYGCRRHARALVRIVEAVRELLPAVVQASGEEACGRTSEQALPRARDPVCAPVAIGLGARRHEGAATRSRDHARPAAAARRDPGSAAAARRSPARAVRRCRA